MRKILILILLSLPLLGQTITAKAQANPVCYTYNDFPVGWTILAGTDTISNGIHVITGVAGGVTTEYGYSMGAAVKLDLPYVARVYSIGLYYYYAGEEYAPNQIVYPGLLKVIPYRDNAAIGNYGRAMTAWPDWRQFDNVIYGEPSDTLTVSVSHSMGGAFPENQVALKVYSVCLIAELPPTATPNLFASPTTTTTPSITPSLTSTLTNTPITDTPTPSITPTDTTTPATATAQASATFDMTLVSGAFYTPKPPDDTCTDILNPCPILPVPNWGSINLPSPTAIPIIVAVTGTPMATFTVVAAYSTQVSDYDLRPLASKAAEINTSAETVETLQLLDADGTPVGDAVNTIHSMGQTMAIPFNLLRSMQEADIGHWWALFVFLLLLLAFNILIRISIFFVPIVIAILRLIAQVLSAIFSIIKTFIPLA
jgi:hypothetical protein